MKEDKKIVEKLISKGVMIDSPESVYIDSDVDINRIKKGAVILPGSRIHGKDTLILKDAVIGKEGPCTVKNCWIGEKVEIKSGYVEKSVFLEKASVGSNAHIRVGTVLEEEASTAHAVGLKQTILFPYVTLGSLINFCDCFMSGGTSRKDHSEVGSSYIHFNYTPNQDKATASLIGDVPKGVMLNNSPVFLGGQGGLVGPCRLTYGNVVAAGTIQRKDELREDRLMFGGIQKSGNIPFKKGFNGVPQITAKNIIYIANLKCLEVWYKKIRKKFISDSFPEELLDGLLITLDIAVKERIKRLGDYFNKAVDALYKEDSEGLIAEIKNNGTMLLEMFEVALAENALFEEFEIILDGNLKANYIETIKSLPENCSSKGTLWLEDIIEKYRQKSMEILPSLKIRL